MTLRSANRFQARISNPADGTRPAAAWGVTVTPGNNAYGTAVELVASGHATWSGNGDGHLIDVNINSNFGSGVARDALVTIVFRREISGVDAANNELDFAAPHGFDTADPIRLTTSAADPPDPLVVGTEYFVIWRSSTSIALATSEANARAGTAIDITDAGTGTHTAHCDKMQHLSAACAAAYTANSIFGGHNHSEIPLLVPNGTAIDAKATVNNATVGTLCVAIRVHLNPTHPWKLRTGTHFRTFGATPATSQGTDLTWGTTSEGALTELGTIADDDLWYWKAGFAIDNTNHGASLYEIDLAIGADSGSAVVAVERAIAELTSAEAMALMPNGGALEATNGHKVYARGQVGTGAATASTGVLAYAVGGRFVPPGAYTVAGTVEIDGSPVANGKTVEIYAVDADGDAELVTTATTGGGTGAFSASVPDNSRDYFASYDNDGSYGRSALDTPV